MKDRPDIYLRALRISDAETTYKWRNDPESSEMTVGPFRMVSPDMEREWMAKALTDHYKGIQYICVICLRSNVTLVGMSSLDGIDHLNRTCMPGLMIGKEYCGSGIAKKAYFKTLRYAFEQLNM